MSKQEDARDGWRKRQERVRDAETDLVRQLEQSGELRHLHGKPLDSDGDSDWVAARILKQQGFSHPVLERGKEVDGIRREVERPIDLLRRRYQWLTAPETRPTAQQIEEFNRSREQKLQAYRESLAKLNIAIRDYNLGVHESLHRPPIRIDDRVERIEREIPAMALPPEDNRARGFRFLRRFQRS